MRRGWWGVACGAVILLCAAVEVTAGTASGDADLTAIPELVPSLASDRVRPHWRQNLFVRFASDQKFLMANWWPRESRRLGFVIPLAIALTGVSPQADSSGSLDHRWQQSVEDWTSDGRRGVAETFTRLGDRESALVIIGSTYLAARWAGNERLQRTSSLSAEALLSSALYASALKQLSQRERPTGGSAESFPSGHTMGAFSVAAVVSGEFSDKRWVPWVAYGTAGLIGWSRVGLGRHFPSDVLAGAVLGQSLGRMVSERDGGREDGPRRGRLQPLFDEQTSGIGLAYRRSWSPD